VANRDGCDVLLRRVVGEMGFQQGLAWRGVSHCSDRPVGFHVRQPRILVRCHLLLRDRFQGGVVSLLADSAGYLDARVAAAVLALVNAIGNLGGSSLLQPLVICNSIPVQSRVVYIYTDSEWRPS
jgi:hypothetical protein